MIRRRLADTARDLLLLASHNPSVIAAPLFVVGALVAAVDARFTRLALNVALVLSALLVAAVVAGERLHRQHDSYGVPCRWCGDLEFEEEVSA